MWRGAPGRRPTVAERSVQFSCLPKMAGGNVALTMKVIHILQVLVALVAAGLIALVLVSDLSGPGRRVLDNLEAERSSLELRSRTKTFQNERLRDEVRALKSNRKVVEHRIREDLGFVKDDELVIVVPK